MRAVITLCAGILIGLSLRPIKRAVVEYPKGRGGIVTGVHLNTVHEFDASKERIIPMEGPFEIRISDRPDPRPQYVFVQPEPKRDIVQWVYEHSRTRGASDDC